MPSPAQTSTSWDAITFPRDTVLAKTVFYRSNTGDAKSNRRLETQLLHRNGDDWNAYNYVWNDDQSDAVLQDNVATDREITIVDPREPNGQRTQTWHTPAAMNACCVIFGAPARSTASS